MSTTNDALSEKQILAKIQKLDTLLYWLRWQEHELAQERAECVEDLRKLQPTTSRIIGETE